MTINPTKCVGYILGAAATVALGTWTAAVLAAAFADIPLPLFVLIVGAASTSTLTTVMVVIGYYQRRAARRDARTLLAAVARLSERLKRIDPIQIYTWAVEDMFKDIDR